MEAYFITDEPGAGAFPGLGKLVAYLRERDPAHLAYINLFPTYANEQQLGVSADAGARAKVGLPDNFAGVGTERRDGAALPRAPAAVRRHRQAGPDQLRPLPLS
jgi:hypothetical protein